MAPRKSSEEIAEEIGLPTSVANPSLVGYRSVGIGLFGAGMRWAGMPLEKIALFMNSSQVSGKGQFQQAIKLTFREGYLAPYRVVGPASLTAWFMQYSVMGVAFQFFDQLLSNLLDVRPMYYGRELMEPPVDTSHEPFDVQAKQTFKTILSPIMAACLESYVSNRAEVQRYFGPKEFAKLETQLAYPSWRRAAGPAFGANACRNVIMCQTSFLLTPLTYKLYFPQEQKNVTTLFWYGLGLNIFTGNVVAITQQALWGRSLDYLRENGNIRYKSVISNGLKNEGISAFFTVPKWFSRVLMNAPAQGTLPWFYNEILPIGEPFFLETFKHLVYDNFTRRRVGDVPIPVKLDTKRTRPVTIQKQRTHYATLPTANPEFADADPRKR